MNRWIAKALVLAGTVVMIAIRAPHGPLIWVASPAFSFAEYASRPGPLVAGCELSDHKGASWASTWIYPNWGLYYSISHLGLARAFVLGEDASKAKKAYQDFFALWKEGDQDIPILIDAQKEYAALH